MGDSLLFIGFIVNAVTTVGLWLNGSSGLAWVTGVMAFFMLGLWLETR